MTIMGAGPPASPFRIFVKLIVFISLILLVNWGAAALLSSLDFALGPDNELVIQRLIMLSSLLYAIVLAIPFLPGVEIGFTLLCMVGAEIVPVVYFCTLVGLTTAFLVGRLLPLSLLTATAAFFHLSKMKILLQSMEGLDGEGRLDRLLHNHSSRFLPFLTRHRYLTLALAINLPGNFLIGGGGGIAMIAGLSRVITLPKFALTIAIATSPIPLAVLIFGKSIIGG
jgi:hypothetical protein